jgi:ATP/ADP translocase
MLKVLKHWFDFHDGEIRLFIWSLVLLFLIRSSGIIFNNFAETAFLKRYGVEFLPIVYMVNSVVTFIIMVLLAGIMRRLEGTRLLIYVLLFCGVSVAALRPAVYWGMDLLYPLLFILKAQYEILLGLLFWNLANDLFNIRQSKRLFPLIIAGSPKISF